MTLNWTTAIVPFEEAALVTDYWAITFPEEAASERIP